jgi:predicted CoA-binding protein
MKRYVAASMIPIDPKDVLRNVETILVIDWPSKEVPQQLALAGYRVVVRSGPGPEDYSAYEVVNGEVVVRRTGRPPEQAQLIYAYRPLSELPQIIAISSSLQTKAIWTQSGLSAAGMKDPTGCWLPDDELRTARNLVEAAGLTYITQPYIADVVRDLRVSR